MLIFSTALITVSIMLLYCVPGFILIKARVIAEDHISAFSKLLLYAFQPFMIVYLLMGKDNSRETLINIGWFSLGIILLIGLFLTVFFFVFRKKAREDTRYRIYTVATCLTNCSFMGVPLLEALLPGTDAPLYSAVFSIVMNVFGWTAVSSIIVGNSSFIKPKRLLLNPLTISLVFALPIFLLGITFPSELENMIVLMGRMTTPLSMMIIGMRLATVKPGELLCVPSQYLIVFIKMIIYPIVAVAIARLLPMPTWLADTMIIICCCPVASLVLNFSEFVGKGQKVAVNLVLIGTLVSVLTLPIMLALFI